MHIDTATSDNIGMPLGAIGEILHDLCQPLTALECSLELAMLRGSVVEMKSLTSVALDSARRLHALANQAQAIEALNRQYRRPRVVSVGDIASAFAFSVERAHMGKKIYVDPAGLSAAFHCITGIGHLCGHVTGNATAIQFVLDLDSQPSVESSQANGHETISRATLTSGLVEHLGGSILLSENAAVIEFPVH